MLPGSPTLLAVAARRRAPISCFLGSPSLRCLLVARGWDRRRGAIDKARARRSASRAWESTLASPEQDSGHLSVEANESIFFFDNIYPLKLSALFGLSSRDGRDEAEIMRRYDNSSLALFDPLRLIKRAIPDDMLLKVTEISPRLKDGGVFVKVQHDASVSPSEIEETLLQKLERQPLRPWYSPWRAIRARLVRGMPWLEDLYRFPGSILRVNFAPKKPGGTAAELSEETLYSLFRRYGKIADIVPQPWDSKETPRFAHISFPRLRDAIMAHNCMHGFVVGEDMGGGKDGTVLRLSYLRRLKVRTLWTWITNHPRIVLPILAALLAGISVLIFDPIRQFFIQAHVQHSLSFSESRIYQWLKNQTNGFTFGTSCRGVADGLNTAWSHRRGMIDQLRNWLDGSLDTFIVVTGPRGSGKAEMVISLALAGRDNVLKIDCRPIAEASGEAGTVKNLASEVGYRPIFSWANNISSMIDLAVQSTTGVKAGFSESLQSQLDKILQTAARALQEVAVSERSKRDKDANLDEDDYLEAHPERRPVVVIDNFLHKYEDHTIVYERIAEWAASLVQNKVAHVVFLTSDGSYSKLLSKVMPDRVFRVLSLGDLDHDVAKKYIMSRLDDDHGPGPNESGLSSSAAGVEDGRARTRDLAGLDESIDRLGGRLTDLDFLSRRIKAGQTPQQAVDEIVNENATDIVKVFLLSRPKEGDRKWTSQQAWYLIKALAEKPSLGYNQALLSGPFAASEGPAEARGDAALEALTNAELIALTSYRGRPQTIRPGKPLHRAAFTLLAEDPVLRAKMELALLGQASKTEAKGIDALEQELALLGSLPRQTYETTVRINYLLRKLEAGQRRIADLERDMGRSKKVLNEAQ